MSMKKLTTLLLALVMCISFVACGGPDKQPAIDAYNELADHYNEFVDLINADIESVADEDIEFFNGCSDVLNEYAEKLESDTEFTQEEIDEMIEIFEEFNAVIEEALAEYGN